MTALSELAAWIAARGELSLLTHVSPDGDTLGSALGMYSALTKAGVRVRVISPDPVPARYAFLPGADKVLLYDPSLLPMENALAVDVSAISRLGGIAERFAEIPNTACIDHHGTNPGFAGLNVIDETAGATGIPVLSLLHALNLPIDRDTATCLYVAISTDTGNFSFSNTDARAFCAAAELAACGIDISDIARTVFRLRPASKTKLLGRIVSNAEFWKDGQIALSVARLSDLADCGADRSQLDGLINELMDTAGVRVALLLEERPDGQTKCSVRTGEGVDAAALALRFQGGGHERAAGMTLPCGLPAAKEQILAAAREALGE